MFSNGWLRRTIMSFLRDVYSYIIWSYLPWGCVFVWMIFAYFVFPNHVGSLTVLGIIVALSFTAYFAFKPKSKKK